MLSIIVAISDNNVIGTGNTLPWRMSDDLKRVKLLTMGHHLIMGRKTFESIGRPLPGRTTVIITRQADYKSEGCVVVNTLQDAIRTASADPEAFIFGGGEIFREAIPFVDRIYLTRIHTTVKGDTFFPELIPNEWDVVDEKEFSADEKNEYSCTLRILQRRK